jgi:hypothetical protein
VQKQQGAVGKMMGLGSIVSAIGVFVILAVSFSEGIKYLRNTEGVLFGPSQLALMIAGGFVLLIGRVLHSRARLRRVQ